MVAFLGQSMKKGSKGEIILKQQNECVLVDGVQVYLKYEFKLTFFLKNFQNSRQKSLMKNHMNQATPYAKALQPSKVPQSSGEEKKLRGSKMRLRSFIWL